MQKLRPALYRRPQHTAFATAMRGFTLVELVMVIVILGVIGGIVAVFMRSPIEAYFSSGRRAALTDVADTTLRRIARDVGSALPNSIGTALSGQCLYFVPTKVGGRYRTVDKTAGDGTALDFTQTDTSFNMLGSNAAFPSAQRIAQGDYVAIYNLGIPGASIYASDNVSRVSGTPTEAGSPLETSIAIDAFKYPLQSGSNRFHVIASDQRVVSYVCSGGNLYRSVNSSSFANTCATFNSATTPLMSERVSACSFSYGAPDLARNALVNISMQLQDASTTETVSLQQDVHVNATP